MVSRIIIVHSNFTKCHRGNSRATASLYYKTVRILSVCADEIEKTTGPTFKILFATDRFALGHCQKNTEFFP